MLRDIGECGRKQAAGEWEEMLFRCQNGHETIDEIKPYFIILISSLMKTVDKTTCKQYFLDFMVI